MDSPAAANVFGTLGAVLWSLQVGSNFSVCSLFKSSLLKLVQALTSNLEELAAARHPVPFVDVFPLMGCRWGPPRRVQHRRRF